MTEQELTHLLAYTRLKSKMQVAMRLHFVAGHSLADAARAAGVTRQDAHAASRRVLDLQRTLPPPEAPLVVTPAAVTAPTPGPDRGPLWASLEAQLDAGYAELEFLEEGTPEHDAQADKCDTIIDQMRELFNTLHT